MACIMPKPVVAPGQDWKGGLGVTSYTHDVTSQIINVAYIISGIHL